MADVNLGKLLGRLVADLSVARAQADIEATQLAELYEKHELLKHFPVPRIRLKETQLDIPLIIKSTEKISPDNDASAETDKAGFSERLRSAGREIIVSSGLSERRKAVALRDWDALKSREKNRRYLIQRSEEDISREYAQHLVQSLVKQGLAQKRAEEAKADLLAKSISAKKEKFAKMDSVMVGITSAELKEADPGTIVRIKLTVVEEGMEWAARDDDGPRMLVPE